MYKNIVLKNDFHGTEATIRVSVPQTFSRAEVFVSESTRRRVWNELCGKKDCCPNYFGQREKSPQVIVCQNGPGSKYFRLAIINEEN